MLIFDRELRMKLALEGSEYHKDFLEDLSRCEFYDYYEREVNEHGRN